MKLTGDNQASNGEAQVEKQQNSEQNKNVQKY